jgi:hypothetical protein
MELSKWKRRRLTPKWGENHTEDEPCVVVFAPPTVGWMSKWRELAINAPKVTGEDVTKPGRLAEVAEWSKGLQSFRDDMIGELVLDVENLTMDGKGVSRAEAIEFILDNEGLREEVFLAIVSEGTLSKDAGKD